MKSIFVCILVSLSLQCMAQTNAQVWTITDDQTIHIPGERKIIPQQYLLTKLDVNAFKAIQAFIPLNWESTVKISLPSPDGNVSEFRIFEYPMMESALASKYPQIRTYTAINTSNTSIVAKIDFTIFGFHAAVFNGDETYYIDPYSNLNDEWYVVYYKKDYKKSLLNKMHCEVDDEQAGSLISNEPISLSEDLPVMSYKTSGDTLRTYRLALACTEEYSAAVGGSTPTKASVLSAMVTSVNRVNGVFEKEFSMHANLVGNNDTLIFLPGSGDPYTNSSGSTMLGQNQTTCNNLIGSSNYDFGHVFSTGGGGIASLGSVCGSSKANGVTGSSNPVGDPFDIDYVAHEMGHQFGGSHTFNSVTGSCNGNRSSSSAFEIGSGTTIQAYAGICGSDDIQPHSDDYYHVRSLEQMTGNTVKACATKTISGNTPPVLTSIAKSYIIPYKTDFELTATATDANNDTLTFCWEEYDRGGSGSAWNAPTTVAPLLRSFYPSKSGTRVFPQYSELIKNTVSYLGERLPDTNRIMKFRCTVRDIHNGQGAFYTSIDTTKLDVRKTTSLFRVSSQNTVAQQWNGFESQTITWDVAGTSAAPFSSSTVDIYLSVDSGKTFTYPLVMNTPNDGSEVIGVPNVDATWARVKVKATGNVYFDLNDEWIKIIKKVSPNNLTEIDEASVLVYPNPSHGSFNIELPGGTNAQISIMNTLGEIVYSHSIQNKLNVSLPELAKGMYIVKVKTTAGKIFVKKLTLD
ncbi:MAG: T9SS type A sorting domain-containing protein [Bacteroidetes bacterium]|nr:T9SS type A sorting domain-containing protein [Bacteroidota bacterium]